MCTNKKQELLDKLSSLRCEVDKIKEKLNELECTVEVGSCYEDNHGIIHKILKIGYPDIVSVLSIKRCSHIAKQSFSSDCIYNMHKITTTEFKRVLDSTISSLKQLANEDSPS